LNNRSESEILLTLFDILRVCQQGNTEAKNLCQTHVESQCATFFQLGYNHNSI